jgi:hypothetical protein
VFFLDAETGTLAQFFTDTKHYVESHGLRVGMPTRRADKLAHRQARGGCSTGMYISSSAARLVIPFRGGTEQNRNLLLEGGSVEAFALDSKTQNVGVWDCL